MIYLVTLLCVLVMLGVYQMAGIVVALVRIMHAIERLAAWVEGQEI